MGRLVLTAIIVITVLHGYGALQVQMPEHAELQQPEDDLQTQIRQLQKNVTDIWTYIQDLRSAVSQHLTHLRQHQAELESSVHRMEHSHGDTHDSNTHGSLHGDSHHHSGEQHSHSGEHHSHGDGHDSHSHGSDSHSHSGEHHSHSGEQHAHSGEHGHHSHSYSHSSHDHSKEDSSHSHSHDHGSMPSSSHSHSHDDHSHGSDHSHDHKDSHENEDVEQGVQQVASDDGPLVAEPIVIATTRQEHYHHHHDHSQSSKPSSGSSSNSMDLMNENTFHHHHHGHHHHSDSVSRSSRNRTVELPKYSDYDMYDFALCNVQPNRAIPEDQQQNIGGQVTLWQKKSGGPLNIHVHVQGFQMGDHHGHHGAHQAVQQEQDNETPQEDVGHKHGFHIHTFGDLSNGCQSTGPHFNPKGVNHGGPTSLVRHVGDLGNIECDGNGVTNSLFSDDIASLQGQYSIIGKSMVIHSKADDLGQGGDVESTKTGNAGARVACCVIQQVDKLPIRYYKVMKTASQYQNY